MINFGIIILHISNKMWIDVMIKENADVISVGLSFKTLILITLLVKELYHLYMNYYKVIEVKEEEVSEAVSRSWMSSQENVNYLLF